MSTQLDATYTDWALIFQTPWPPWAFACAATLLVAATAAVLWSYRGVPRAWPLVVLRCAMLLAILVLLLQPTLQLRRVRRTDDRIGIVVDRSASMQMRTEGDTTRWQRTQRLVHDGAPQLAELGRAHKLGWFDLAGPVRHETLATLAADGVATDLLQGLEQAREADGSRPLAGLVLLSDGADNAQLRDAPPQGLDASARLRLAQLGVPVNVIDVAATATHPFRDLAVANVQADAFAFIHNTFSINVALSASGFAPGELPATLPVTLKKEGLLAATQGVALDGNGVGHAAFKIKPDTIGDFVYSVSVPPHPGEASLDNNQQDFVVQIIRDKIRVLQVSGRPSWDERFLRQYLKENPNTDLVSFFILRTPSDDISIPESELSLIPFPVGKLFTTELQNFDVIIFQNFDFRPYHMAHFLPNIRDAVQAGLGFVMLGGDASFSDGGFLGTALDDILPVRLGEAPMGFGPVAPVLTEAGLRHPITDLAQGGVGRQEIFAAMPRLTGANAVAGLRPGAVALAADPHILGSDGTPAPLIAAQDLGKGRTLTVASDALWRWQFAPGPRGTAGRQAYQRLWSNALRWLVRDPEHAHVRVTPANRRVEAGSATAVTVQAVDADYRPLPRARLQVGLTPLAGGATLEASLTTDDDGSAQSHYPHLASGAYRVTARGDIPGLGQHTGSGVFVVAAGTPETREPAPRPQLLAQLAQATGGVVLPPEPKSWSRIKLAQPDITQIDQRRDVPLWDNLGVLIGILLLFAADWALRRRRGFF
jgi:uncharacterized membrane protein